MNFILSTESNPAEELKDLDEKMKLNSERIWKQSYGRKLSESKLQIYRQEIDYIDRM